MSVSFEEDEEGNLCLIAYPLHSDLGDLENVDPSSDLEPKNKMKWSNKMLLDNEGYSKERARHSRKDKDKRWEDIYMTHIILLFFLFRTFYNLNFTGA